MKKTAVIYARVSTARQAEEELPIQGQLDRCNAKAEELGASAVRSFVDEGISGRTEARPAFQAAIEHCEIHSTDFFVTWSTSRFARNKLDAALYKMRLARAGTEMVYVSMAIDRTSDSGWMTEGVMELFDEFHSRQIAADTTRSMIRNAQQGYWNGGRPPLGYRSVPADDNPKRRRLAIEPGEAELVRRIFRLRIDGHGAKSIAISLNDAAELNRGKLWGRGIIAALLRNRTVVGQIVFNKKDRSTGRRRPIDEWIIVDSHAAIIDPTEWEAAQAILDAENPGAGAGSPHSTHLFTGILRCGECGSAMHIESAKGRRKRYWYYICSSAKYAKKHPPRRVPADEFDGWLSDVVCDQVLTPDNLRDIAEELNSVVGKWAKEHRQRHEELSAGLRAIEGRNEKIFEVLELHGKDAPHLGDLTNRLRRNNAEIKRMGRRIEELEAEPPPSYEASPDDMGELADLLRDIILTSASVKKVRAFFRSFIDRVVVDDGVATVVYHPEALARCGSRDDVPSNVVSVSNWLPGRGLMGTRKLRARLPGRLARAA